MMMRQQPIIVAYETRQQVADHIRLASGRGQRPARSDREVGRVEWAAKRHLFLRGVQLPVELRQRRLRSLVAGQLAPPSGAVGSRSSLATGEQRVDLQLAQALG